MSKSHLTTPNSRSQQIWGLVALVSVVAFAIALVIIIASTARAIGRALSDFLASTPAPVAAASISAVAIVLVAIVGNYVSKYLSARHR
jgi:hypothetical protein